MQAAEVGEGAVRWAHLPMKETPISKNGWSIEIFDQGENVALRWRDGALLFGNF